MATRNGIGAYVADPRRVLLARNGALVVTDQGVNVMHRGDDGAWRYAIVLQAVEESNGREKIIVQETIPARGYSRWPSAKMRGTRAGGSGAWQ